MAGGAHLNSNARPAEEFMSVGVGLDEVELPSEYKRLNTVETERARQEYEEKRLASFRNREMNSESLATSVRAAAPNFRYQQNPNMNEGNRQQQRIPPPINHRHSTDADAVKKYKQYVNSSGFRNK